MLHNKKKTFEQHDNESESFYQYSVKDLNLNSVLEDEIKVDVCIIGGGFTGISTALNLRKKGYNVALIEARKIGSGASGRNGGQVSIGMRRSQKFIEKKFGFIYAKELWNLGIEALEEVKKNISNFKIDCAIKNGVMHAGYYSNDYKIFLDEIEHMQKFYNFDNYEFFNSKKIRNEINSKKYFSGMLNKSAYHLNPLKLLYGMTNELLRLNVKIYENSPAIKIEKNNKRIKVFTKKGNVTSDYLVVGCNGYLDDLLGKVRNKYMPINNYIIATEPLSANLAKKFIKNNYAICDTRFIIDYYRFSEDWRMLFGGGETLSSKFLKNPSSIVSKRMYKIFPELKKYKIDFYWGGTLAITVNRLPHFGDLMNGRIIFAQGYSGHGVALSNFAGKLISEKISGYSERFDFFKKINHMTIPGGDILRRPIYSSAIAYYKFKDLI